jgi:hypothetical protein
LYYISLTVKDIAKILSETEPRDIRLEEEIQSQKIGNLKAVNLSKMGSDE